MVLTLEFEQFLPLEAGLLSALELFYLLGNVGSMESLCCGCYCYREQITLLSGVCFRHFGGLCKSYFTSVFGHTH